MRGERGGMVKMTVKKWQEKIITALRKYPDWVTIDSIMIDIGGRKMQGFYKAIDDLIISGRVLSIGNEIKSKI